MQWFGMILPRLHCFLPAETILEIAPGFGRWTQFLKDLCRRLIAVDVTERCVEQCRERFQADPHVECHVNDGRTLGMVATDSVDLAVTFDSLVHVEDDVMDSYVEELARVLRPQGVAVLHHSNFGAYPGMENRHHRGTSMTAAKFVQAASDYGLICPGQELLDWGGSDALIDCISIAARPGSRWDRPHRVLDEDGFTDETRRLKQLATIYGERSYPNL